MKLRKPIELITTAFILCFSTHAQAAGAQCAIPYQQTFDDNYAGQPRVGKVYCPAGQVGSRCDTHFSETIYCSQSSPTWYQDAITEASSHSKANSGARTKVYLTRGEIVIDRLLPAWWPYGGFIGTHLPANVDLSGAPRTFGETKIRLSGGALKNAETGETLSNPWVPSLLLVAGQRTGLTGDLFETTQNNRVSNLTFSGSNQGNYACENMSRNSIQVGSAIYAGDSRKGLRINDVVTRHFLGNAFELGVLMQWVPEIAGCKGFACQARRLRIRGVPSDPVNIENNDICDSKFGGIVVVGEQVRITNNKISLIERTWNPQTGIVGLTMGISASFGGTTNVEVSGNTISGGDYGIGTDGSFPLLMSVDLFKENWALIKSKLGQEFSNKYPQVPLDAAGNLALQGHDFVLAQQVLFDKGSAEAIKRKDESGFGSELRLHDNTISDSVTGVSLYRMKNTLVYDNRITGVTDPYVGVDLNLTYSSFVYNNEVKNWRLGVRLMGAPGSYSELGSSFNGIGVVPPQGNSQGAWLTKGNHLYWTWWHAVQIVNGGWDNSVRGNVSDAALNGDCDYTGAKRLMAGIDWTTENSHVSCNSDY